MAYHNAEHQYYKERKQDFRMISALYTGDGVETFLTKRYFEGDSQFADRKKDGAFEYTPHFFHLISNIGGQLFAKYNERDVDAPQDFLTRVLPQAGPMGTDYSTVLEDLVDTLLAFNECYVIIKNGGLQVVSPLQVPNWNWDAGKVLVKGSRTMGTSLNEDRTVKDTYTLYTPQGFEVYVKDEDNGKDMLVDRGTYGENRDGVIDGFYFVDRNGNPAPPVLHIKMPWRTNFGLNVAKKAKGIFELESRSMNALSASVNGKIQYGVVDDDKLAQMLENKFKRGESLIPYSKENGEHKGLQVPTDGVEVAEEVIKRKTKELYRVAFKELDQAVRTSATEAMLQHRGGVGAALSILSSTIEDAETRILSMLYQTTDFSYGGPDPRPTGITVSWPKDFSAVEPMDV